MNHGAEKSIGISRFIPTLSTLHRVSVLRGGSRGNLLPPFVLDCQDKDMKKLDSVGGDRQL